MLLHTRVRPLEAAIGIVLLGLGVAMAFATANLPVSPLYSRIGPTVVPTLVSALTIFVGLMMALSAIRDWRAPEMADAYHPAPMCVVAVGLVLHLLIIKDLGFVIASTVLFATVARAFSERRPLVAVGYGLAMALISYVGFKYGLRLDLPSGPLPF